MLKYIICLRHLSAGYSPCLHLSPIRDKSTFLKLLFPIIANIFAFGSPAKILKPVSTPSAKYVVLLFEVIFSSIGPQVTVRAS